MPHTPSPTSSTRPLHCTAHPTLSQPCSCKIHTRSPASWKSPCSRMEIPSPASETSRCTPCCKTLATVWMTPSLFTTVPISNSQSCSKLESEAWTASRLHSEPPISWTDWNRSVTSRQIPLANPRNLPSRLFGFVCCASKILSAMCWTSELPFGTSRTQSPMLASHRGPRIPGGRICIWWWWVLEFRQNWQLPCWVVVSRGFEWETSYHLQWSHPKLTESRQVLIILCPVRHKSERPAGSPPQSLPSTATH